MSKLFVRVADSPGLLPVVFFVVMVAVALLYGILGIGVDLDLDL